MIGTGGAATPADESERAKADLRACYRAKRRALSVEQQARHAQAVADSLLPRFSPSDTVAVYLRQDGELDLAPVIAEGRKRGVAFAAPVLAGGALRFAAYRVDEPLRRGRYGLLEPAKPLPMRPTLVLVPVVAFDVRGNRLGMGGGYYDRYFAEHRRALRIGVAHECQRAGELPVDRWDVRLDAVVTERGLQWFDNGKRPA